MVGSAVETTVWSNAASQSARNSAAKTVRMDVWLWLEGISVSEFSGTSV